jgi:hypothetical protein
MVRWQLQMNTGEVHAMHHSASSPVRCVLCCQLRWAEDGARGGLFSPHRQGQ